MLVWVTAVAGAVADAAAGMVGVGEAVAGWQAANSAAAIIMMNNRIVLVVNKVMV
ncbi:MAG: hypothetical protein Kow0080_28260 [Candidatus Promineifilaceae bacterium]